MDTATVVAYPDQPLAAVLDLDLDTPGLGIDAVLDQLLDHRGRSFDDLPRGDLTGQLGTQRVNAHWPIIASRREEGQRACQ